MRLSLAKSWPDESSRQLYRMGVCRVLAERLIRQWNDGCVIDKWALWGIFRYQSVPGVELSWADLPLLTTLRAMYETVDTPQPELVWLLSVLVKDIAPGAQAQSLGDLLLREWLRFVYSNEHKTRPQTLVFLCDALIALMLQTGFRIRDMDAQLSYLVDKLICEKEKLDDEDDYRVLIPILEASDACLRLRLCCHSCTVSEPDPVHVA